MLRKDFVVLHLTPLLEFPLENQAEAKYRMYTVLRIITCVRFLICACTEYGLFIYIVSGRMCPILTFRIIVYNMYFDILRFQPNWN